MIYYAWWRFSPKQYTADRGTPGHIADHYGSPVRVERAGVLDDHSGSIWEGGNYEGRAFQGGVIITEAGLPGYRPVLIDVSDGTRGLVSLAGTMQGTVPEQC